MDFKRVQFLKKQMESKIGREPQTLYEEDAFRMDALTLAYMGDVCWSLFIRRSLIYTGIYSVQILHSLAADMVSARVQCRVLLRIRDLLSERELKICRRGRNTHSTVPKSATVEEYRESTAFEALLGYLYLSGQADRLHFLMNCSLKFLAEEFSDER